MTPKEAIEILMSDEKLAEIEYYGGFEGQKKVSKLYSEAFDMAIEALKKQIAEKTDVYSDGYADGYEVREEHCPNCYYDFDGDNPSYCPRCGQKLSFEGLE